MRRGLIVGFHALITAGRQQVEGKTPVYIANVQRMTEEFLRRLQKKPVGHDSDEGGGESTVGQGVTPHSLSRKHHRRRGGLQVQEMALSVHGPREC